MSKWKTTILICAVTLMALGMGLAGHQTAIAQTLNKSGEVIPPTPVPPARPGIIRQNVVEGPNGYLFQVASEAPTYQKQISPVGGPDNFGYTWNTSEPYAWIDATDGFDTGLQGVSWGHSTGRIALYFPFKFYEHTYTSLFISASGYISFSPIQQEDDQFIIPSPTGPNNIIAPYAGPLFLSTDGTVGRVYYKSGGRAPNRYFVVEWYRVSAWQKAELTFEVILHENGDIVFQYKDMNYGDGGWACGAAGIEDELGTDGLSILDLCARAPSNTAIRLIRPAPTARVKAFPRYQGSFASPGTAQYFMWTVENTGDQGEDFYHISVHSDWPITLSIFPVLSPNTNDAYASVHARYNALIYTDQLPEGKAESVFAEIDVPADVGIGDTDTIRITVTSHNDPTKSTTLFLSLVVPEPFAMSFSTKTLPFLYTVQPKEQKESPTSEWAVLHHKFWGQSVLQTPNGFISAWHQSRYNDNNIWVGEVKYAILDHDGNLNSEFNLTDLSDAEHRVYNWEPRIAVLPNGKSGFLWSRWDNGIENLYFALVDTKTGAVLTEPVQITHQGYLNAGFVPYIASTKDGHFVITWDYFLWGTRVVQKMYYAVLNSDGTFVHEPTLLDEHGKGGIEVATITNNQALIAYSVKGGIKALIVDSAGNVIQPVTTLIHSAGWIDDVLLLPNGNIAIAWEEDSGKTTSVGKTRVIRVATLDNMLNIVTGPITIMAPGLIRGNTEASLTTNLDGNIIVVWRDMDGDSRLFYSVLDPQGNFLVAPSIFTDGETNAQKLFTNGWGQMVTTYLTFGDVPYTNWAAQWIESLYNAGVTSGCGNGMYCPNDSVTRAQMAKFILKAIHGADYTPPSFTQYDFSDIANNWARDWIEELYLEGIVNGYSDGTYRPNNTVTRAQMAKFILKGIHGADYTPPAFTQYDFSDIANTWAADWIEELYQEGVVSGYGDGTYRPNNNVTRAQMAVFLVKGFELSAP